MRGNVTTMHRLDQGPKGKMSQALSWINVLNEETQWHSNHSMRQWLSAIFCHSFQCSDEDLEQFEAQLAQMRRTIESLHFGEVPDVQWLDKQLACIKLTVCYESFLPQSVRTVLPLLHAQVQGNNDPDLLKALGQTLLIQFAEFVAATLGDQHGPSIARCEGLFRDSNQPQLSIVRSIPEESERKWREEIEILRQNELASTASVQRCADIFISSPKARFCSDACRFTTFQLVKQLKDPRYHAEKQKKYRSKLGNKE
jgi:hypothetical protein